MISPVTKEGVLLNYAPEIVMEIDRVINQNLENPSLVALFISRLLKNLQNPSNADIAVQSILGNYSYEIEDIGMVAFKVFVDTSNGVVGIVVESIRWSFASSRFFLDFVC